MPGYYIPTCDAHTEYQKPITSMVTLTTVIFLLILFDQQPLTVIVITDNFKFVKTVKTV